MTRRDADELGKPAAETGPVGSPQLIVKKHPNSVESDLLCQAKLGVDAVRIVGTPWNISIWFTAVEVT